MRQQLQAEAEAVAEAAWDAQDANPGLSLVAVAFLPWLLGLAVLAGFLEGIRQGCARER